MFNYNGDGGPLDPDRLPFIPSRFCRKQDKAQQSICLSVPQCFKQQCVGEWCSVGEGQCPELLGIRVLKRCAGALGLEFLLWSSRVRKWLFFFYFNSWFLSNHTIHWVSTRCQL